MVASGGLTLAVLGLASGGLISSLAGAVPRNVGEVIARDCNSRTRVRNLIDHFLRTLALGKLVDRVFRTVTLRDQAGDVAPETQVDQ